MQRPRRAPVESLVGQVQGALRSRAEFGGIMEQMPQGKYLARPQLLTTSREWVLVPTMDDLQRRRAEFVAADGSSKARLECVELYHNVIMCLRS